MPAITVRNVPDNVHDELVARAARKGKSLQEYLLAELERVVAVPDPDDWWDRVRSRAEASPSRVTADDILGALREVRSE